jgi:DNA-directed RNA polymerase subunit N (RpoN/RPB10)
MIIPVRCFSCGKVIGNKYETYLKKVRERKLKLNLPNNDLDQPSIINVNEGEVSKTIEGKVLDELGLDTTHLCCRKMLLTHIPVLSKIN